MIEWLKQHWFLFGALALGGVAWGQNVTKVNDLQTRLDRAETIVQQQNRIDERTTILQTEMREQRAILMEILVTQRAIANERRVVPVIVSPNGSSPPAASPNQNRPAPAAARPATPAPAATPTSPPR